jgi:hypothetical protein
MFSMKQPDTNQRQLTPENRNSKGGRHEKGLLGCCLYIDLECIGRKSLWGIILDAAKRMGMLMGSKPTST